MEKLQGKRKEESYYNKKNQLKERISGNKCGSNTNSKENVQRENATHKKDIQNNKFIAGDLYEDFIEIEGHRIDALAEVQIDENKLILRDLAIYFNEGDIPNKIGTVAFKNWLKKITVEAKQQGFNVSVKYKDKYLSFFDVDEKDDFLQLNASKEINPI